MKVITRLTRATGLLVLPMVLLIPALTGVPAFAQSAQSHGATAELKDAQGQVVGRAVLSPESSGVRVQVQVQGFSTAALGEHGIHLHAVGACDAPQFTTAGGHFNPQGKKHGLNSLDGHHAGDMPNIVFDARGAATYDTVVPASS